MEVYYQVTVERYKCGACQFTSYDVKTLHAHVKQHSDGSYFFCQDTTTAYPRYRSTPATTQTELLVEVTSDDIIRTGNSLRFIPELDTSSVKAEDDQADQASQLSTPQKAVAEQVEHVDHVEQVTHVEHVERVENVDQAANLLPDDISEALEEIDDYTELESSMINKESGNPLVEIPLSYKSMSSEELLKVLLHEDPNIPDDKKGKKNYMVIQTDGYKVGLFDDGVSWESQTRKSTKQCYSVDDDYKLSQIFKKGSGYYVKRMHNKRSQYEILQPQPACVITFQKVSVNLAGNDSYRRRITTIVDAPPGLDFLTNKGVVEYYMDITSVQKISGREGNVNVTLPDCTKLKEMLYPGIPDASPSTSTPQRPKGMEVDDKGNLWNTELMEDAEGNLFEITESVEKPVIQPIITGYQYMNNDEQLQVLMTENETGEFEETKHYRIFKSRSNGFQKQDVFGVWKMSGTSNLTLSVDEENKLTPVTKKDNEYHQLDWKNRKAFGEPLSPQPTDLLVLQRCSFKLANSNVFKKRETIVWSAPDRLSYLKNKHLVEYCGSKCLVPKIREDENGQTKLVVPQQLLHPCEGLGDEVTENGYNLDVSKMACTYMSNEELLERLILDDTESKSDYDCGNNYMVIKNEKLTKKTQFYLKDGCVWNSKSGTTTNQFFAIDDENNIRGIMKRDDKYCIKKRYNRKTIYEPLEPQPTDILIFHKYSTSLKNNPLYKKRVTSVLEAPERLEYLKTKVLVEYFMDKSNMKTPLSLQSKSPLDRLKWKMDNMSSGMGDGNQPSKRKISEVTGETDDNDEGLEDDPDESVKSEQNDMQDDTTEMEEYTDGNEVHLPVGDIFMNAREIWKTLQKDTTVASIMQDTHDKNYILLSAAEGEENVNSSAYQDGLLWDGVNFGVTKQDFIIENGNVGKLVIKKDGVFCLSKKEKKRTVYEILKPQPKKTVTICRSWTRLKSMPWYRKRITKLTNLPEEWAHLKSRVLVEYCMEQEKNTGIEDDVDLLNSLNREGTPGKKIEDVREMLDLDELDIPEPVVTETPPPPEVVEKPPPPEVVETPPARVIKTTESLYEKPYLTSPDVSKVYRSERLKQRQIKRQKIDQEVEEVITIKQEDTSDSPKLVKPKIENTEEHPGQMMTIDKLFETLQSNETFSSVKERPIKKSFILLDIDPEAPDRKRLLNDNFAWNSSTGTTSNQSFRVSSENHLTLLIQRNGKYCARIKDETQPNRIIYKPLKPQPKEIVTLHRYFVKGKGAQMFMKRVTSVKEVPERLAYLRSRVLVEYSTSERSCFKKSM